MTPWNTTVQTLPWTSWMSVIFIWRLANEFGCSNCSMIIRELQHGFTFIFHLSREQRRRCWRCFYSRLTYGVGQYYFRRIKEKRRRSMFLKPKFTNILEIISSNKITKNKFSNMTIFWNYNYMQVLYNFDVTQHQSRYSIIRHQFHYNYWYLTSYLLMKISNYVILSRNQKLIQFKKKKKQSIVLISMNFDLGDKCFDS